MTRVAALLLGLLCLASCRKEGLPSAKAAAGDCTQVDEGFGPAGEVPVQAERVVAGLEVPWAIAFLPGGDLLVTERPGRLRLVRAGRLVEAPVATLQVAAAGEAGLLGLALHPAFAQNRLFYLYLTAEDGAGRVNRIERWRLAPDATSASFERRILDGIPAGRIHDGGRLRFGPDGMLYASSGEGGRPERAQDPASLGGKLLRLTPEGEVPEDNPLPGSRVFLLGVRNSQGFDWRDSGELVVVDHGPSGELGRRGHDEVNLVSAGANLGWPEVYGCEAREGMLAPSLVFRDAVPPAGASVYRADLIPEWKGDLLVATLGSRHLHRVRFEAGGGRRVALHETYFLGEPPGGFGRLREAAVGPDGALYLTTSNCDGRGDCPEEKDQILRVTRGSSPR